MVKKYDSKSAIKVIQTQIKKIEKIAKGFNKSSEHTRWLLDTNDILMDIFGEGSTIHQSFVTVDYTPSGRSFMASYLDYEQKMAQLKQESFLLGLEKAKGILESGISLIRRKGLQKITTKSKTSHSKNVFVVHGHDIQSKDELVRILEKEFNLDPIVLMDKPNQGKTLIEKFEKNILDVGYAFVILTPDDAGYSLKKKELPKHRARENVILELGYFLGALGRENVCCLRKGNTTIPSDLHGIVDIRYKENVKEVFLDIKKELQAAKLIK